MWNERLKAVAAPAQSQQTCQTVEPSGQNHRKAVGTEKPANESITAPVQQETRAVVRLQSEIVRNCEDDLANKSVRRPHISKLVSSSVAMSLKARSLCCKRELQSAIPASDNKQQIGAAGGSSARNRREVVRQGRAQYFDICRQFARSHAHRITGCDRRVSSTRRRSQQEPYWKQLRPSGTKVPLASRVCDENPVRHTQASERH